MYCLSAMGSAHIKRLKTRERLAKPAELFLV